MANAIITRAEAKAKGLTRYFTGKPCPKGHIAERATGCGGCVTCKNDWQRSNSEYYRQYWAKNKERRKAILEKYHNSETRRECWDKYYKENRERIIEYQREYRNNPDNMDSILERRKKYRASHKADFAERATKRKKHVKIATPAWYNKEAVRLKYKERDIMKKITGLEYHVDHIIPLQGKNVCGLHTAENMRVILARDNTAKSNKFEQ